VSTKASELSVSPEAERGAPTVSDDDRAVTAARAWTRAAMVVAAVLAIWLIMNWLAGSYHAAAVADRTVDGGRVGTVLAFLLWATLAMALALGVIAARRPSGLRPGSDADAEASATPASQPAAAFGAERQSGRWGGRWTAVAWVGAGAFFVLGVYHGLLRPGAITWGDWGYLNAGAVRDFFPVPSLWSFATLGKDNFLGASLAPIDSVMGLMARLGTSYDVLERLWFYFPAVILSYLGPVLLARRLRASWPVAVGAGAFYGVNPYALTLISGGQLTVGMGYALYPWVTLAVLRLWSRRTVRAGLVLGGVIGVQAWYDPRTAGLSFAGIAVASVVLAASTRQRPVRRVLWTGVLAGGIIFVLLQGAWLIPAVLAGGAHLPAGYTTESALSTFSLLTLADGLTVFHPFWPTMIFIVLHGVPALWIIVPVVMALALSSDPTDRRVHVGVALYLVFSMLLSGANPPFGPINTWLFTHVPGMDLFRDPSPYFGPVSVGVIVTAVVFGCWAVAPAGSSVGRTAAGPDTLRHGGGCWRIKDGLERRTLTRWAMVACVSALVVLSGWPALSGSLKHDLSPQSVPTEYRQVDHAILDGPAGAVLWVPSTSTFAPVSPQHPSVSAFQLDSISGVDFPSEVQSLDWLTSRSATLTILQQYDISTIVVRRDPTAYRALSLPPLAVLTSAISTLRSLPGISQTAVSGLTVFHLAAAPYPVTVLESKAAASRPASAAGSVLPKLEGRQELAYTSFATGLRGWENVGDGNNYLKQSLAQAGISASVVARDSQRWLHMTVKYGAAVMSQPLLACPTGMQEFEIRYRTSRSASLTALVFSPTEQGPVGIVSMPSTRSRRVTASTRLLVAPTFTQAERGLPLTGCIAELSVQPDVAGTPSWVDIESLSLVPVTPEVTGASIAPALEANWNAVRSASVQTAPTGDRMSITVPAASRDRLVVFWQKYDPRWVARATDAPRLRHIEVDGWANGYLLPPAVHSVRLDIEYTQQHLTVVGFLVLLAGFAIMASCALFSTVRWIQIRRNRETG
jgi:hypothetical protein